MSLIPTPRHHVDNVGTQFLRNLLDQDGNPVDLTTASSITFRFRQPAASGNPEVSIDRTGSVVGAPTDGVVQYTTVSGDLSVPGNWQVQVLVVFTGGRSFAAEATPFKVDQRIAAP